MISIKRGICYLFTEPLQFIDSFTKNFLCFLPDKYYLSLRYRCLMGHWINWKNPKTFSEKLQWLKVFNRSERQTQMVDKYEVKQYVSNLIGEHYVIPTLGVWDSVDDIPWDSLPNQFVLKTTHGGGGSGVVICKDKRVFDKHKAIKKLSSSMCSDIYKELREWPYKNVKKRIIAELYLHPDNEEFISLATDSHISELNDYKFFCFQGKVKFFKVDFGRFVEHHANYYSVDGMLLNFGEQGLEPDKSHKINLPSNLQEMIALAETLSHGSPFLRVDFYNLYGKIYFGELTFFPASGLIPWSPIEADMFIGQYLILNN